MPSNISNDISHLIRAASWGNLTSWLRLRQSHHDSLPTLTCRVKTSLMSLTEDTMAGHKCDITWASWRLKSPQTRLFVHRLAQACTQQTWKLHITRHLHEESTSQQWISVTKGSVMTNRVQVMTSWHILLGNGMTPENSNRLQHHRRLTILKEPT